MYKVKSTEEKAYKVHTRVGIISMNTFYLFFLFL